MFLIQFMYIVVEFDYERAAGFRRSQPAATPNVPIAAAALLPFGGAAVVAYFSFAVPAARAAGFEATTASTPWAVRPWQLASIAVVVALGAVLANSRPAGGGPGDRIHLSPAATVLALAAATGWTAVMVATYRQAPGLDAPFVVGAVVAAQRRPQVFAAVAAFSVGGIPHRITSRARAAGVRHYLAAGTLEPGFRQATRQCADQLRRAGLDCHYQEWVGGHDQLWWAQQLPAALGWLLTLP